MNKLYVLLMSSSATDNVGQYNGNQHWAYYLMGAIFLVLTIICGYFAYRWRHSKQEAENYNYTYNEFVKFWQLNKFALMLCLVIVFGLCTIIFFMMNDVILKNNSSSNQATQLILFNYLL